MPRPSRRSQPYRKGQGTRVPGPAMKSMTAGRTAQGGNPADVTRALQKGLAGRLAAVAAALPTDGPRRKPRVGGGRNRAAVMRGHGSPGVVVRRNTRS